MSNGSQRSEPKPPPSSEDGRIAVSVWEALAKVYDPELHYGIVDLGLVYGVDVAEGAVTVRMTFTSPACPYGPWLAHQVREAVKKVSGVVREDLKLVWDPPWGPALMSEDARLELGFDV